MAEDDRERMNIHEAMEERADAIEEIALTGNVAAIAILRRLGDFHTMIHNFSEGEHFGWALVGILDPVIDAWNSAPKSTGSASLDRAHALCADLLELASSDNGHGEEWDHGAIVRLRAEARSILIGTEPAQT